MDVSRPPGVSSSIISASAFISAAFLMDLPIYSEATGLITPLTVMTSTSDFLFSTEYSKGLKKRTVEIKISARKTNFLFM